MLSLFYNHALGEKKTNISDKKPVADEKIDTSTSTHQQLFTE